MGAVRMAECLRDGLDLTGSPRVQIPLRPLAGVVSGSVDSQLVCIVPCWDSHLLRSICYFFLDICFIYSALQAFHHHHHHHHHHYVTSLSTATADWLLEEHHYCMALDYIQVTPFFNFFLGCQRRIKARLFH